MKSCVFLLKMQNGTVSLEKCFFQFVKKLNIHLSRGLAFHRYMFSQKEWDSHSHKSLCSNVYNDSVSNNQHWKQLKCSSMEEQMSKLLSMPPMEHCLTNTTHHWQQDECNSNAYTKWDKQGSSCFKLYDFHKTFQKKLREDKSVVAICWP